MTVELLTQEKIIPFSKIGSLVESLRKEGKTIVQCHGVFDLLHPGHIRHFKEAKAQGDILVVTLTRDEFVNKGPGRPAFTEALRMESLSALKMIDYVVLSPAKDAVTCIKEIAPDIYVKGPDYKNSSQDITGKIEVEKETVESLGGTIYFTSDIVFSSSSLLNRYVDSFPKEVTDFLKDFKKEYTISDLLQVIEDLSQLKVLVIGDAILDSYQYVSPLGQSGKGHHMVARCEGEELFLGGSLIVANHLAEFAGEVTLITSIGKNCPQQEFIYSHLNPNIDFVSLENESLPTLEKKRYVVKDGSNLTKLFETYSSADALLSTDQTKKVVQFLQTKAKDYDLVLACDFGNGFTNPHIVHAISNVTPFLAVNTQTNSGNRGFHVITHYRKADFISLNEPEIRGALQDRYSSLESIIEDISLIMHHPQISVTRGVQGVYCFSEEKQVAIPALSTNTIDRIGAGDAYLSLASMCAASGAPLILSGFIGSAAAAMNVQMVGNSASIQKVPLSKFLTRLLK
jgi:rfaE bifunctional protein nucleotidyltransferase chain/domain